MRPTSNRVCSEAEHLRTSHGGTEKLRGDAPDTSLTPTVPQYPLHPALRCTSLDPTIPTAPHSTLSPTVLPLNPTGPPLQEGTARTPWDSGILLPLRDKHPRNQLHSARLPWGRSKGVTVCAVTSLVEGGTLCP